ncbi:hypothetical protein L1049_019152 [Liquidambar formosana]|uniref:CONSTANS-like protein n=1 Tax=Liquidambar formosana TaxID=63359 RepID=A0AAP0RB63_LIQFO
MSGEEESVKGFTPSWSMAVSKLCDSCKSATATLFCRPDSAFLCLPCDAKIHAANKLASRHPRVWMCEVCEQAPAHVTCKADAAALCVTCDRDIHSANPLARRHERFPVTPFYDSSAAASSAHLHRFFSDVNGGAGADEEAEAASWIMPTPNLNAKVIESTEPHLNQYNMFSDIDPYLDLDYAAMDHPKLQQQFEQQQQQNNSSGADGVVPVQSKNLQGPLVSEASESYFDVDFGSGSKAFAYNINNAHCLSHSVSSSSLDVGVVPDGSGMVDVSNPFGRQLSSVADTANHPSQISGIDREARVLRYREKRKNRKFEKTIRYASRKAYAETRPRIKGRFAKRSEMDLEVDQIYTTSSPVLVADAAYGVVPSF